MSAVTPFALLVDGMTAAFRSPERHKHSAAWQPEAPTGLPRKSGHRAPRNRT